MRISDWSSDVCSSDLASPLPVGEHRRHLAIQRRDRTPGADCPVELACGLGAVEARPRGERRRCREYEKQCRCHDWIPGHVCPCHSCPSVESAPVFTKKRTPVWLPGVKSAAVHSIVVGEIFLAASGQNRSEERREGKECVSTCRSWWS